MDFIEVEMPGGVRLEGGWRRDAILRPLAGCDEAFLLQEGRALSPASRTTAMLARCLCRLGPLSAVTADVARSLSVGDRDALLLHLRRLTLGETMPCVLACPICAEKLDLELQAGEFLLPPSGLQQVVSNGSRHRRLFLSGALWRRARSVSPRPSSRLPLPLDRNRNPAPEPAQAIALRRALGRSLAAGGHESVSNFLNNLALRGAGLAPRIAPRLPSFSSPASLSTIAAPPISATRTPCATDVPAPHVRPDRFAVARSGPYLAPNALRIAKRRAPAPTESAPISDSPRNHRDPPVVDKAIPPASASSAPEPRATPAMAPPSTRRRSSRSAAAADAAHALEPRATSATAQAPVAVRPEPAWAAAPRRDPEPEPFRPHSIATVAVAPALVPQAPPPQPTVPIAALPQTRLECRTASSPAAPPSDARPVHVRIGKVELRAGQPAAPPARASRLKGNSGFAELALARAHLNRIYR